MENEIDWKKKAIIMVRVYFDKKYNHKLSNKEAEEYAKKLNNDYYEKE